MTIAQSNSGFRQLPEDGSGDLSELSIDNPIIAKAVQLSPRRYDGRRFTLPRAYISPYSSLNFEPPASIHFSGAEDGSFTVVLANMRSYLEPYYSFPALIPPGYFAELYPAYLQERDTKVKASHRRGPSIYTLADVKGWIKDFPVDEEEGQLVLLIVESMSLVTEKEQENNV